MFRIWRMPDDLPRAGVATRIDTQGGLVHLPHPYDPARGSLGAAADALCADGMADIVEVFNAKIADQALNQRAAALAARFDLPGGAGAHPPEPPGLDAARLEVPGLGGPPRLPP